MVEQTYYSIDKEPGICAKYIAQAIKAKPVEPMPPKPKKAIDQITERVSILEKFFKKRQQ